MNTFRNISLACLLAVLALLPAPVHAQASFTTTTLTYAVTASDSSNTVVLGSTTGVNGPALPYSQGGIGSPSAAALTLLMIDGEVMRVNGLGNSTGQVLVERGYFGTVASTHLASAKVWVGPASYYTENEPVAGGACVSTQQLVLPRVVLSSGPLGGRKPRAWNCAGPTATTQVWGTFDGYAPTEGATIASVSSNTIAPTNSLITISGTPLLKTVTVPAACQISAGSTCKFVVVPTGAFTTDTTGNVLHASTAVVGVAMEFTYQPSTAKWAVSY